jgi:2-dehydropantoate 2-reductase
VRIVVAGAGALGSVLGGLLTAGGEDVVLIAHGAHGSALARRPLELRLPQGVMHVEVQTAHDADADVVILTSKRFDSQSALAAVHGRPSLALSLQNGLGKNAEIEACFGAERRARAATTLAARLVEPGVVSSTGLGVTYISSSPPTADWLAGALRRAGLEVVAVNGGAEVEWSKLAHVAGSMAVQALVRVPLHDLFGRREAALTLTRLVFEVSEVAAAAGSGLRDLPGLLPVATLASADDATAAALLAERGSALERSGATDLRTSMLTAIDAGRRTEIDAIHGEIIRRAHELSVDVPALETCYRIALATGVRA